MFDDMTPRYVPDRVLCVAWDTAACRYLPTAQAVFYPAGTHSGPIQRDMAAVQVIAANGQSRWYGCIRAYINAELRMVIVGTNSRDEVRAKWEIVPEDLR